MAALTRHAEAALGLLALAAAIPAHADALARWRGFIAEASTRFGVPVTWIESVLRAESGGRATLDGRPITSSAGAMGLMQLMPDTWADMRRAYRLGSDPYDAHDNILAGTAYLRWMYDRFGYPGCFAAYNAGPARYADHLASGRALPAETLAYLAATGGAHAVSAGVAVVPQAPAQGLFVALRTAGGAILVSPEAPAKGLFATLRSGPTQDDPAPPQHR